MSARDPPNLRRWVEWGVKSLRRPESKVIEESFELVPKTVSGDTTRNGQRKGPGVPNSWSYTSMYIPVARWRRRVAQRDASSWTISRDAK